jgi:hypothetical protein
VGHFEKRCFLLHNIPETTLLECISDCLGVDRVGDGVVNEMGGLYSIVKLPRGDLSNEAPLVSGGKLERRSSSAILLIPNHLLLDPTNSRLP